MKIAIYGPGRAGGALAIAASRAGHQIASIEGRRVASVDAITDRVSVVGGQPDLLIIAVSDDALARSSEFVRARGATSVIHVSGAVRVSVLQPFADAGALIGSFHPLQTLPDADSGADRLAGAYVGITAEPPLRQELSEFAVSLGCIPFTITDEAKPLYHAAAAVSANATIAALAVGSALFSGAGVEFSVARPLIQAAVDNAFAMDPGGALTGPISRGDVETVRSQIEAVRAGAPDMIGAFVEFARATAQVAGQTETFREVLQ